jgi:hypothetical protein
MNAHVCVAMVQDHNNITSTKNLWDKMGVIFISSGQLWYANFQHFDLNNGGINGFF